MGSRKEQGIFRIGNWGISQIPLNIIVAEYYIVTQGVDIGKEKRIPKTQRFFSNYDKAFDYLIDCLIIDGVKLSQVNMVQTMLNAIKELKKDVSEAIKVLPKPQLD